MATSRDEALISVRHLTKKYNGGAVVALNDCNIDIARGEVVSIIGPSGSGKSTLLRSLNLLEAPTSGSIFFDGVNLADKKVNFFYPARASYQVAEKKEPAVAGQA